MNLVDFRSSFLSFTSVERAKHTPRLQLDAVCRTVSPGGSRMTYVLTVPCMSEHMYRPANLIQEPVSHFAMFAAEDGTFAMLKHHASADDDVIQYRRAGERVETHDKKGDTIAKVDIVTTTLSGADHLENYKAIRDAILDYRPMNGITAYTDKHTGTKIELEYPIKTSNIGNARKEWQMDVGPVIMPDPGMPGPIALERMRMAFLVFNAANWTDVAIKTPTALGAGGRTQAYSRLLRLEPVDNRLYAW